MKITNYLKDSKKFNTEELLNFCAKELKISDDVDLTLVQDEKLLKSLSKETTFEAILHNPIPKVYILYTLNKTASHIILCHEMTHLWQHERGDLKTSRDLKTVVGKGNLFDNSTSYDEREGEKEAFSHQNKLGKKFKKSQKK